MAVTLQWLLEQVELTSQASTVSAMRVRNAIVLQRIQQEIQAGETEPQQPPPKDTKDLDEAWDRLEQLTQKPDIEIQLRSDLIIVLANLDYMYRLSRWGKK